MPDFRNMKNKNHMKIFPPHSQFLFCFKPIKQSSSTSQKICLFLHSLNVEKRVLTLHLFINDKVITPGKNTPGETVIPFSQIITHSISDKTGTEKIKNSLKPPLPLFKGIISTFLYKAGNEFDSSLIAGFAKIRPCI